MDADDLQELYNNLRGSRSALAVLDARSLYVDKEYRRAHGKLQEAYATYQESRTRLLRQNPEAQFAGEKDADRQIRRLKRKQEKAREILEVFEDLLSQLDRRARREKGTQAEAKTAPQRESAAAVQTAATKEIRETKRDKGEISEPPPPTGKPAAAEESKTDSESESTKPAQALGERLNIARPSSVSEKLLDEFQENYGDDRLDVIGRNYAFLPVESEQEIYGDALYFISKGDESYLVYTPPREEMLGEITLTNAVSRKLMSPIPAKVFVQLGLQRKIVLLLDKDNPILPVEEFPEQDASGQTNHESGSSIPGATPDSDDGATDIEPEKQILDMGAFSQLMDAAQRCGLVPGADQIGHVRDREFRKGNYDLALQAIEGLYSRFSANEAARSQKLRQEEADISAGRTKISPKDLQAKRATDRAQDQAVERARSRFNRVLDGLRILIKTS